MCAHAVILQLFVKIIFPPKFDNKQTNSLLHVFVFQGYFNFTSVFFTYFTICCCLKSLKVLGFVCTFGTVGSLFFALIKGHKKCIWYKN